MPSWDAIEPILRRAYESGRVDHEGLRLEYEAFAGNVRARLHARAERDGLRITPPRAESMLAAGRAGDLFLAAACDRGVPGAWERLAALHDGRLRRLLRHWGATEAEADQLADELPGELASTPPNQAARTRIGTYDGSGSLSSWLAVIARRRWADLARAETRQAGERPVRDTDTGQATPPLDQLVDEESGAKLASALQEAWTRLTPRESLVLLYRFADGLPQRQIAMLLGVGPPRVSRLLKQATSKLRLCLGRHLDPDSGNDQSWTILRAVIAKHMATFKPSIDPPAEGSHD